MRFLFALAAACALLSTSVPAYAHIRVVNMTSRDGDAQKDAPCGAPASEWGKSGVTTLAPGATVTVTINEYIKHPGYFRIAFDRDGGKNLIDPVSIQPIDLNRKRFNDRDQDVGSDFCSNPTVLMDNLDAHMSGGGMRTYEVKLPDIECERCTLQIIQVMEDTIHGPYNVTLDNAGFDLPDLYHQCIDVTLKRADGAAAPSGTVPPCTTGALIGGQTKSSAPDAGTSDAGGELPKNSSDSGCALATRSNASGLLLALGLLLARARGGRKS